MEYPCSLSNKVFSDRIAFNQPSDIFSLFVILQEAWRADAEDIGQLEERIKGRAYLVVFKL